MNIVTKILNICKTYQHGLFIGFCLLITAGIGYNIGRITSLNSLSDTDGQSANISGAQQGTEAGLSTKITQPSPTPIDQRVVVSKAASSKLYHYSWCSGAKRIKESNKLWFPTEADAISAGYTLAGNCQ